MTELVRSFETHYVSVVEEAGRAFEIVKEVENCGMPLLGFSMMPDGSGKLQLDLIPEHSAVDEARLKGLGLTPGARRRGFVIHGRLGETAERLAQAGIGVTNIQAMAGGGEGEAFVWVAEADWPRAAGVLGAGGDFHDAVDEASEESFPASDPPSFAASYTER